MRFQAVLTALAILAFGLGLAAQEGAGPANRTETREESLAFGAKLSVRNHNGAITVSGWNKEDVELSAEIRDSEQRRIQLVVQRTGPDLEIEAQVEQPMLSLGFGDSRSPKCRMTLNVPHRLLATFRTINGPITVDAIEGFVRCETTNGDIRLTRLAGEVQADTINGNVAATGLHARIRGGTANGRIELVDVDGQVKMATTNGFIMARNLDGWGEGISLESTNGAIDLELGRAAGDLLAVNANGSIRLKVPGARILEATKHRLHAWVPGSHQRIALGTTNGSILVH